MHRTPPEERSSRGDLDVVLPPFDTEDLSGFAAAVAEEFDVPVVITGRKANGSATVMGLAGVDWPGLRTLWPSLEAAESVHLPAHAAVISETAELKIVSSPATGETGPLLSAVAAVEGQEMGALHLVGSGTEVDLPLLTAVASHVAWAIARRRLKPEAGTLEETMRLPTEVVRLLTAANSLRPLEVVGRAKEVIDAVFDGVSVGISVWDEERQVLRMLPGSFGFRDADKLWSQSEVGSLASVTSRVFRFRRSYLTNDQPSEPRIKGAAYQQLTFVSTLACPLLIGDRAIGVLHVCKQTAGFGVRDLHAAELLARPIAVAVELTVALSRLHAQNHLESIVSRAAVAIADGQAIERELPQVLEDLRVGTEAKVVALVPSGAAPTVAASSIATDIEISEAITAGADPDGHEIYVHTPVEVGGGPTSARLVVPIMLAATRQGGLVVARDHARGFSPMESRCFSRLVDLIALSWAERRDAQRRMLVARLEERQRLADELHDYVAQILYAAQIQLDAILDHDGLEVPVAGAARRARALLVRGDEHIRQVIADLPQVVDRDLETQLGAIASDVRDAFSLEVDVEVDDDAVEWMQQAEDDDCEAMLRIARECVVNAAKHADAERARVVVAMCSADVLRVTVSDSGIGLPDEAMRSQRGLAMIRRLAAARGWALKVDGDRRQGTTVALEVPVRPRAPA